MKAKWLEEDEPVPAIISAGTPEFAEPFLADGNGQLMVLPNEMECRHVEVLRLQPSDKLVVTVDKPLTNAQIQSIQSALKPQFPNHQVLIFSGGMKLTVIRADESIIVED